MADRARSAPDGVEAKAADAADALRSEVGEAAQRIGGKVREGAGLSDIADDLKGTASDLTSAAVEQGRQFYETARSQATSFVDERKNDAAQSVADLAASLRETGNGFGERPNIQAFVGSAADGLDQLASGLKDRSFADLYGEAEAYARRAPGTVAAVAVVAGFLLARFIKSSSDGLSETHAANRTAAASAARRRSAARASV